MIPQAVAPAIGWTALPGAISARQQQEHLKLYQGYLDTLAEGASREKEAYARAGVLLHELYFQGLAPTPSLFQGPAADAIVSIWGSKESLWQDMRDAALAARGWALLAVGEDDPEDLVVFALDSHVDGLAPGYTPLLAVDVYEHAYWMDHGADKGRYLDALAPFIRWEAVETRLRFRGGMR